MSSTHDGDGHLILLRADSTCSWPVIGGWTICNTECLPPAAYLWALTKCHGSWKTQTKENIRIRGENGVFNLHQRQGCFSH